MSHIHTKPGQHDQTASAFIVRPDFDEPKVMIHMHKKLGMLIQFGGHVELHETPWQAVTHELREESGYEMRQLKLLQPKDRIKTSSSVVFHPYPLSHQTHKFGDLDHYHTDICYGFVASEPPHNPPADGESNDIRLLTRKELLGLTADQIPENVKANFLFVLDHCLHNWERVPAQQFDN